MERYSRQEAFFGIGAEGQQKLLQSRVCVIGLGALGSASANLLARAGVGFLRIVDRDYVELSNLQRQMLYREKDAEEAAPKAAAAAELLTEINSQITIEPVIADVNSGNITSLIEDVDLPEKSYDVIYFNGSSSYMEDLVPVYQKSLAALKEGGKLILLDVPKESAFGFMYLLGKSLGTYEHAYLEGTMPALPYPLALASSGVWHSTEEKIEVLKKLGITKFSFYQTLLKNPMYTNEEPEEVSEGYKSGGYVAIIAEL